MTTLDYASFYETHVRPRRAAERLARRAALVVFLVMCPTIALMML